MNRLKANEKILKILEQYINEHPDMRFIQILWALDIINMENEWLIEDRFHEESEKTLEKLILLRKKYEKMEQA